MTRSLTEIMPGTWLGLWATVIFGMTAATTGTNGGSYPCTSTCSTQRDVVCVVKRLPYPCLMPDQNDVDHPNKPTNLTSMEYIVNTTRTVHLTWFLPKGFSYRAVKGFSMEVNTLHVGHQCYHFNLSTVNWTIVKDVKHIKFHHCLTYNATQSNTVFINLYSLPKATDGVESQELKLKLPALDTGPMIWEPNISTSPLNENLTVTFSPWLERATYVKACLAEVKRGIQGTRCRKEMYFRNKNTHSWFADVLCNRTYIVLLRPYVTHNSQHQPVSSWVKDDKTLVMPCYTPETTLRTTPAVQKPPTVSMDTLPVVIISLLLLCLLMVFLVIFWFRRSEIQRGLKNLFCCKSMRPPSPDPQVHNNECNERVFPIYYPENPAYEKAVVAHIHLLHRRYGLNIDSYDDQRPLMRQDMHAWVQDNLKHNAVLLYYSKTIDDFKKGRIISDECKAFGPVCFYALQRLETLELAGQAITPVHVTFDGPNTSREYGVEDIISLVREENDKLYIENFDTIVYKLTNGEMQNLNEPNEAETRDLRINVSQLYDLDFLDDDDGISEFPEHEPMVPPDVGHPFLRSDVYRKDMGSTDSCPRSELPFPGQNQHPGDSFVNPHHLWKQTPYSPLTEMGEKSSGYNSGSTGPFISDEYVSLKEKNPNSGHFGHRHFPFGPSGTEYDCEQTYRQHVYTGQEVDTTGPKDSDSTYTLELDHLGHPPRMLDFIAPEIPASNASLTRIQEEILQVNQTSLFENIGRNGTSNRMRH